MTTGNSEGRDPAGAAEPAVNPLGRWGRAVAFAWHRLRRPPRSALALAGLHRVPWAVWLVVAVALVGLAAAVVDAPSVPWAEGLPDGVRSFFAWLTDFGQSQWTLVPSGVLAIALGIGDWAGASLRIRAAVAEMAGLAAYVFLAVGASAILANAAKQLIGRARPVLAEDGRLSFDPFDFDYAHASFPSGHATSAGAAMVALAFVFPRLRPIIVALGLAIAASRVVVGAHFPSDVVAGLCLGAAVAYGSARYLAGRGFVFRVNRRGRVVPVTGAIGRLLRGPGGARVFLAAWRQAVFAGRRARG